MRLSDPDQQARAWARDLFGPDIVLKKYRTATEVNRAASEKERLGWYTPSPWLVEKLTASLRSEEDRMFTHKTYSVKFPVDAEAIRAEVARINAEREREQERQRPTPEGTAKLVREIVDRTCLLKPIYDSKKLHEALVEALEPIFTSTWARGFDDGQEQLRDDLQGVLDEV